MSSGDDLGSSTTCSVTLLYKDYFDDCNLSLLRDKDDIDKLLDGWWGAGTFGDEKTVPNWAYKKYDCTCGIEKVYGKNYPVDKHPEYCDIHGRHQKSHRQYFNENELNNNNGHNEGAD